MQSIVQAAGMQAEWMQPAFAERRFELRSEDQVFATLQFNSAWGSLATAVTSAGSWTYKRTGFFNIRVTVRPTGSETEIAVYHPRWTGAEGELIFANGPTHHWKSANFWATRYAFLRPDGSPLVTFLQGVQDTKLSDFFKYQSRVEIHP